MIQFLHKFAANVVRYRRAVLSLTGLITLLLSVGVGRLQMELDPDLQLPQSHPYIETFHETTRLFGDKNLVVIGLRANDRNAFTPHFLRKAREITDRIGALPGAVAPLLLSIASTNTKDISLDANELRVRPFMSHIPATQAEADALRMRALADPLITGGLVSFDASALAIYATFELSRELPGYVHLHRAILRVLSDANDGSFTYLLSGPVVIAAALTTYSNHALYFFPIALILIAAIHYEAFRSWQAVVLPLLTGILAVFWALGLMGHLGVPIDPLNSTTPVLILAIGAGHAVQILNRYYEELTFTTSNETAIVGAITRVGSVMLAAGLIAAFSFLSLAGQGTQSLRTFGVFTAFGIFSVLLIEMTLIPALRASIAPSVHERRVRLHSLLQRILTYTSRLLCHPPYAKAILWTYAALALACAVAAFNISIDTSLKGNFADTDPVREQDNELNELFLGTNSLIFLIEGPEEGSIADPSLLRGVDRFERRLEDLPAVGRAVSLVDTVKGLHRVIGGGRRRDLPDTKELATQYIFLYTLSGADGMSSYVTPDNRIAKITVLVREDSTNLARQLIADALTIASEELPAQYQVRVTGSMAANLALSDTLVRGKLLNVVQIAVITIAVAALVLRSLLAGLMVAIPLAVATLVNFGVMGTFGIRLDITTAAVTAMAVGIGADYGVYLLFRFREELSMGRTHRIALHRTMLTSGRAIIFVSSAVGLGYAVLCFSGFRVFVQLGALVGLAMFSSSISALLILPSLLTLLEPTSWYAKVTGVRPDVQQTSSRTSWAPQHASTER